MTDLKHILPGEPIPRGSLFHERRYRVAALLADQLPKGRLLLDIGCGNCSQTEFFAQHVNFAVGIDLQVQRLHAFKNDLQQSGMQNITLVGGSAVQLPFADNTFDYLTCFEVLEHVNDQSGALKEIRRVLRADGALIMSVPHRWWIFETHGADLPLLPWNRVPGFSWLPKSLHDRWARARIYTKGETRQLLLNEGFRDIQMELLTAPMDVIKNKSAQRVLRKYIFNKDMTKNPFLASTILICAKK